MEPEKICHIDTYDAYGVDAGEHRLLGPGLEGDEEQIEEVGGACLLACATRLSLCYPARSSLPLLSARAASLLSLCLCVLCSRSLLSALCYQHMRARSHPCGPVTVSSAR
jgi:hypothetical protein